MAELSYQTLRENAASAIRMKILSGELAPGMRIIEQNLSREFGISRGPIREALRQLEQEGLVEYVRNAGCSVREITVADVYELYLLRSTYEILAMKLSGGTFTEKELAEMEAVLRDMRTLRDSDVAGIFSCDSRFHRVIIRKSGLPRLTRLWEDLNYCNALASVRSGSYRDDLTKRQYVIHCDLLEVLRGGDLDAICGKIFEHYMFPLKKIARECGLPAGDLYFGDPDLAAKT